MGTITAEQARAMTDAELVDAVEDNVWNAAHFSRHSHYDDNCSILYRESVRRGNDGLYDSGYRRAEKAAGF